ncbi:threonine aldolase family protein [Aquabacter sp. P-9]|uniref:threonine aldolase family protein n=1 Tax=Aquabacter sediminis TaxID=3029197 RepID=UPI00237D3488|nr:GntG family PLP-dependent aldolase [Aquabacter sp. P-9]MDE1568195.1 GntG family PLP-dependent aldolase [Aquabacter sp. P-9]
MSTINLFSDTQTLPSRDMRAAIADAELGDEQRGTDPSVNRLCERVADMLGFEAALFAPSGTLCNQIAILVHCRPGDELLCDASAHVANTEAGGAAALAGTGIRAISTPDGRFGARDILPLLRPPSVSAPRPRLLVVEQTVNFLGGRVWPLDQLREAVVTAGTAGLTAHLDGARLLNAVAASGVSARAFAAESGFASAWIALSKGLGCPAGAVLCGSRDFIDEAWRWKYRLGGAMRQAGILAAAGLYALDHNVARLPEDHRRARMLAAGLADRFPGCVTQDTVETNIVIIDTIPLCRPAAEIARACAVAGLQLSVIGEHELRAVTHLDITDGDIERATALFADSLASMAPPTVPHPLAMA